MNETLKPNWRRLASFSARMIVRLWPEETKDWGRAFAAELPEIEGFRSTIRWLMGGTMLLTGERLRHFLKSFGRPFGVAADSPLEVAARSSMRLPRTPRVITVSLLLGGSLAILLHPEVRAGLISVFTSSSPGDPSRWQSVHKLQKEAARNGDPKLLAILSLLSRDERLTDQAIAKDSSLTWLDYQYFHSDQTPYLPADRAQQLRNWDPDNAVPRLILAESLLYGIRSEGHPGAAIDHLGHHQLSDFERSAATNQQWMAAMDYAFSAPKYDTYVPQRFQLIRDVIQKYGVSDPDIAAQILSSQRLPNLLNLLTYSHILLYRASEAADRGDTPSTLADAWKALYFAQRMQLHAGSLIENLIAARIAQESCESLRPLLEKAGRVDDAALVAFDLAQWKAVPAHVMLINRPPRGERPAALAWAGLTVRMAAFAIAFLVPVSLAALAFLSWKSRSAVESRGRLLAVCCSTVELAPLLLLFAVAAFFIAYHPYAQVYQTYLDPRGPFPDAESVEGLLAAAVVTHEVPQWIEETVGGPNGTYALWLSAIILLSTIAAFLIYRMLPRRRTA